MTDAELMDVVKDTLFSVAPDLEGEAIEPEETFRDQFEIDSMDFLNFVIGLHKRTGLEIPEADYPKLQTPADTVAYLRTHWSQASC
jgi:acyl carrier protein